MTFFNPKEDVMDIELTQTGKRSLAQGKFKPSYYLFFDDDILYDLTSAGGPVRRRSGSLSSETQNNSEVRIQEKTPKLKTQYSFSGVKGNVGFDSQVSTVEKHFSPLNALGTSDSLSGDSFPRWDVRMFGDDGPKITRAVEHLTSSYGILKIPQIDVEANFRTAVHHVEGDFLINEDPNLSSAMHTDGTYVAVQPRTILMQVLEENSVFEKENFDIEVYIKDTETHLRASSTAIADDVWTPLVFRKKMENIVDGILIDTPPEECKEVDSTHVEYYFDIFVDNEIDDSSMSQLEGALKTQNMYLPSDIPATTESSFEMANIYSRVVPEDPCPDDECP